MNAALLFLPALCLAQAQSGYTISTVAGTPGTSGFTGDAGPATSAELAGPICVAVDSSGNLYIADENNNRIRKISNGTINTVAGNGTKGYAGDTGTATNANLSTPNAVAVDKSGNFYIADSGNFVIRKVTSGGTISTVAGDNLVSSTTGGGFGGDGGVATQAQISFSAGVAVDSNGVIYIADTGNNRVRKVGTDGNISTYAGGNGVAGSSGDGGPASQAHLNSPEGLAVDAAGNLYIADTLNNRIRRVQASNGIITTVAGGGAFGQPDFAGDGGQATSAQLWSPQGVAVDAAGSLYIADHTNSRIRMVGPNGIITTIAGNGKFAFTGDGGPATSAALNFPDDVAVDAKGNVYVADYQNQVIRLLTPPATGTGSGTPSISAGGVDSAVAFGGFTSIAPGSWIEIYGSNLAADTRQWASTDFTGPTGSTAPMVLDRTSVTIGGQQAFVDYISPGQVNVQVPSTVVPGQQQILVSTAVGSSAAYTITVNATQPGLLAPASFVINGKQYVVAQLSDGTYVLPPNSIAGVTSRQAHPGETIIIYGIGFGPVSGATAGQIAPTNPLAALITPPQFSFGPTSASVAYAGLAGGYVGLYQFNIVVPNVAASDLVPLTFTLGSVSGTQTLFTAVGN